MITVTCLKGHRHGRASEEAWRADRGCKCLRLVRWKTGGFHFETCGAPTVVKYTLCPTAHASWRWPNRIPMDGQACEDCGQAYVEPFIWQTEREIENQRGCFMLAATVLDESDGMYNDRETRDQIEKICLRHGFVLPAREERRERTPKTTAISDAYVKFVQEVLGDTEDNL